MGTLGVAGCGSSDDPGPDGGLSSSSGAGATCGDGKPDEPEGCDDGNKDPGDGCSDACAVEEGYACSGQPSACTTTCGDGKPAGAEACDDGDKDPGDGCSDACAVEKGFSCTKEPGVPSVCTAGCGDGLHVGAEGCDDGDQDPGDGCSDTCAIEPGYTCTDDLDGKSTCVTGCGDGEPAGAEECDDGNTTEGDGCSSVCATEPGYECTKEPGVPSECKATCGDGKLAGSEECDDGPAASGDGCSATCKVEYGYTCTKDPLSPPSVCETTCGDGKLAGSEVCDDGGVDSGDGCDASCAAVETGYACTTPAMAASTCAPVCGDALIVGAETCDDDNTDEGDGCAATCAVEAGWTCAGVPSACAATCGDALIVGAETCDDKNTTDGDGCSATCAVEVGWICAGAPSACTTVCGDGKLAGTEACDDSNPAGGDGCGPGCTVETGFECTAPSGGKSLCKAVCGDGLIVGPETCDDAKPGPNDGCDATCQVEVGYTCFDLPSVCTATCGDGVRAVGVEQCDDGDVDNNDCCSSGCQVEAGCEIEDNGSIATANDFAAIAVGGQIKALIAPGTDQDFFKITVPPNHTASGTVETLDGFLGTPCSTNNVDTKINIRDASGTVLFSDDDNGPGACSLFNINGAPPGDYFVEVIDSPNGGQPGFDYVLKITLQLFKCGDGMKGGVEQCDDGNSKSGDGCSSTCKIETLPESEPNNACGGEDGPFNTPIHLSGSIFPLKDKDYFSFVVPGLADLKIETFDETGPSSCATGVDTKIELRGPDCNTVMVFDDDAGVNSCSLIDSNLPTYAAARHVPPGIYYVRVEEYNDDAVIPGYTLSITFNSLCGDGVVQGSEECDGGPLCTQTCDRIPVCGDGLIDSPETCEDGNLVSGDGCSNTCHVEGLVGEVDPNNSTAQADAAPLTITGDAFVKATINPIGDKDYYKIVLAQPSVVRLETFDGSAIDCTDGTTTTLRVFNSAGTEIYNDKPSLDAYVSGIAGCAALTVNLPAGTSYVEVEETGNNAIVQSYILEVDIQTSAGPDVEPNEIQSAANDLTSQVTEFYIQGDHPTGTDVDYYAIHLPQGWSLRAETVEGGAETCESNEIDSYLTLYNAGGAQLDYDDDNGRGWCSLLDGSGLVPQDPPAHAKPAGTYYLSVKSSSSSVGNSKGIFQYRLVITARQP